MSNNKNLYDSLLTKPLTELVAQADKVRKEQIGSNLELCSIINAKSGLCSEDCKFCAQSSRHSAKVDVYSLKGKSEIIKAASKAKEIGAKKFGIVTSGNRPEKQEFRIIAEAISEISNEIGIQVCASLGALSREDLSFVNMIPNSHYQ